MIFEQRPYIGIVSFHKEVTVGHDTGTCPPKARHGILTSLKFPKLEISSLPEISESGSDSQ